MTRRLPQLGKTARTLIAWFAASLLMRLLVLLAVLYADVLPVWDERGRVTDRRFESALPGRYESIPNFSILQ